MTSSVELKDQVAIVTGGGTGIGLGIATEMARAGANIVVASRKMEHLEKAVAQVKSLGRQCLAVPADVRKPEDVDNLVQKTMGEFGRIDVLVNNAGASFRCGVEDMTPNGWDTIVDIILKGTFLCCRSVGKVMIKQQKGNIISISSVAGVDGFPFISHYGAAKAGVINFTKSLSVEWSKHNIRVNCIAPGPILTEGAQDGMRARGITKPPKSPHAIGRWGQPEEIGRIAVFLASEASSFLSGQTLVADGGPNTMLWNWQMLDYADR